jgi:hypothetical protein
MESSSAESREAEMLALAHKLARESRRSAILGFIGGAIVVAGLCATYYSAMQSRSEVISKTTEIGSLTTDVKTQTAEAGKEKKRADTVKTVLSTTIETLQTKGPAVSDSTRSAIDQAFEKNPEAAKLLVRVYMHTHSTAQRARAVAIAGALRGAGFIVPGIDVQPQSFKTTEVHYYVDDSQSVSDAEAILKVLAGAGITAEKRQVPPAATDKLKPRAYGLWLASSLQ